MASATIDNLQIKITATATDAASALSKLASSLKNVRDALGKTGKDGQSFGSKINRNLTDLHNAIDKLDPQKFKKLAELSDSVAISLGAINNSLKAINLDGVTKLSALSSGLRDYAEALKDVKGASGGVRLPGVAAKVKDVAEQTAVPIKDGMATRTGGSADTAVALEKIGKAAKDASKETKKLGDEAEKAGKKIKHATGLFTKFVKSIFRIAVYRAIRSALKSIGEAFTEGLKNAYMFSKETKGFERLAETMDRIASITAQMRNQLGALWGEIKQVALPIIEWLVEKVRAAAEWMTEFIAALQGEQYYLRARYVAKEWAEATDELKKYKHQLLGLDELNNLSTNQDSGKKEEDYTTLYDRLPIRQQWRGLGLKVDALKLEIESIIPDFSNFTSKDLENVLTVGLFTIAGGLLGGAPGAIVGTLGGILLTLGINKLESEGDKTYKKKGVYNLLKPALMSMIGGIIGIKYGGATGALIGATAGMALGLIVQKLGKIKDLTNLNDAEKWSLIKTALVGLTGGIIGFTLGGVKGAVVGASLAISLDLIFEELHVIDNIKDKITTKILDLEEEWGLDLNQDGHVGYGKAPAVKVGTKQLDDAFKPNEPSIDYSSERIVLNEIDMALKRGASGSSSSSDTSWIGGVWNDTLKDFDAWATSAGWYDIKIPFTKKTLGDIIQKDAMGGVERGSLFYAGEAGPEFIGSMGNTSAVANTGQMTDAIYKAAYMGMSRALQENGGGMSGYEPTTMDDLFIAFKKKTNAYTKRTGQPAF